MSTNNVQRQLPDNIQIADLSITNDTISNTTGNVSVDTTGNVVINATSNLVVKSNGSGELHFGYQDLRNDGVSGGEWKIVNTDANSNIHLVTTDSNGAQNNIMTLDSYGRVGIGTDTNLVYGLEVTNGIQTNSHFRINNTAESTAVRLYPTASELLLQVGEAFSSGSSKDFAITNMYQDSSTSSRKIMFKADGNVGIGTDIPIKEFHLNTASSGPCFLITNTNSSPNINTQIALTTTAANGGKGFLINAYDLVDTNPIFVFQASQNGVGTFQKNIMALTWDGNVGIGTVSPISKLHVFAPDSEEACISICGSSQGTGRLFVGQGPTYGGGIVYNGDNSPSFPTTQDKISFYRTEGGNHYEVFNYPYNNSTVYFLTQINNGSDDRIKENEQFISNATVTVMKLRPQIYDKKPTMDNSNVDTWVKESGLIAQEVYYDAPELRHLVTPGSNASNIDIQISSSDDPSIDPDYSNWGDTTAYLNYTGFIPYLIKCCQEQQELIESQQTTINSQQTIITTLQTQYNDLLARVTALETA